MIILKIKNLFTNYLLFYLFLILITIIYSLFNLTGLFNIYIRKIILYIIINIYYFIVGFCLNKKKLSYNIYLYGLPVFLINYIISLFIKPSFIAILSLFINYLCFIVGILLYRIIKKTNH